VNTPPRLLLVATPGSYRTGAYLLAARRRRVDVLVASEGRYSLVSALAGGLHIDLTDPAAVAVLLRANRERPFCGVVATDDATVELASRVAGALGLPHNPPEAARRTARKDLARQALAAHAADSIPGFRVLDLAAPLAAQLEAVPYPCVIKPLTLSGSRGVIRVDTADQALAACTRIQAILAQEMPHDPFAASHLLLERFVPGPEVALEGLLLQGKLQVLAIFDKPDPLDGPYFEETYYVTPSRHAHAVQQQVTASVQSACHALGLREGPVHAEVRITRDGCVIMEVAARTIGGDCARLLRAATGHGLEELVIAHATGQPVAFERPPDAAGVLMIPIPSAGILRRIEGIGAARAVPYIEDISIAVREGYELVPLPEGASYLGFLFARAPTPAQAEAALRAAFAELAIVVAPLLRMQDGRRGGG
jgi:biotin carboxylase